MSGNARFGTPTPFSFDHADIRSRLGDRRNLYLLGAMLLAVALLVTVLATQIGGNDRAATQTSNDQLASSGAAPQIGGAQTIYRPSDGRDGRVLALVGGQPLFPMESTQLMRYTENTPVIMIGATVQKVVNDRSAWVGIDENQEVFVHVSPRPADNKLNAGTLSPTFLQAGQKIDFTGYVLPTPADITTLGTLDDQDISRLANLNGVVEANSLNLP